MYTSGVVQPTDTMEDLRERLQWFTEEVNAAPKLERGKWLARAERVSEEIDKRTNLKP